MYITKTILKEIKPKKIEGLGDVVKAVLQKTGIEKVYKKIVPLEEGGCSPCEARRKALNESKISKALFNKG